MTVTTTDMHYMTEMLQALQHQTPDLANFSIGSAMLSIWRLHTCIKEACNMLCKHVAAMTLLFGTGVHLISTLDTVVIRRVWLTDA